MTDEPWTCGDGCPWRGCRECAYTGGESGHAAPLRKRDNRTDVRDNGGGYDERPTAPTVSRSEPPPIALPKEGAYLSW